MADLTALHEWRPSQEMKIATFNINNVRKRLPNLLNWMREADPDVVCLQTKTFTGPSHGTRTH